MLSGKGGVLMRHVYLLLSLLTTGSYAQQQLVRTANDRLFLETNELFDLLELSSGYEPVELPKFSGSETDLKFLGMARGRRFLEYITAIDNSYAERSHILRRLMLALMTKQHVLLAGPPGNAKTSLLRVALSNILEITAKPDQHRRVQSLLRNLYANSSSNEALDPDKADIRYLPSYFQIQMTPETTLADTHGQINIPAFNEGRRQRNLHEGALHKRFNLFDETFDLSRNALRNILTLMSDREHNESGKIHRGNLFTVAGATNRILPRVFEMFDFGEEPEALIDRIGFLAFVPGPFETIGSYKKVSNFKKPKTPLFTTHDLMIVQSLLEYVKVPEYLDLALYLLNDRLEIVVKGKAKQSEIDYKKKVEASDPNPMMPYKNTKIFSGRTLAAAKSTLKAQAVLRWLFANDPNLDLEVTEDDLRNMVDFYALGGPEGKFMESLVRRAQETLDAGMSSQLSAVSIEREAFFNTLTEILGRANSARAEISQGLDIPKMVQAGIEQKLSNEEISQFQKDLLALYEKTNPRQFDDMSMEEFNGEHVGVAKIHYKVGQLLDSLNIKLDKE